ncbi:uncharacterized protein LOC129150105 [Eptesicus fuscus]|uniref:uncharacterized protein LOC129150105 n=1 Tax=Eptesicus fuscus TaxID=29078 RepID=UPI002403A527|nr:uncharacterized protein LOC129150105 [Eptesicus fuscus]
MNMIVEQPHLLYEYPRPMCLREGPVSHTALGQRRPEVRVATWGSGEPGPMGAGRWTPPPEPHRPHQPPTRKPFSPNTRRLHFNSGLPIFGPRQDLEPKEAEPKAPAQGAHLAPPVTPKVHPEELEAPEPVPPPAASPAAAVEPGPAPDTTEAPPALEEEPSPGPLPVPASEEELPVEAPTQRLLVECPHPVISVFFIILILFLCSPWFTLFFGLFTTLEVWVSLAFIILLFSVFVLHLPIV